MLSLVISSQTVIGTWNWICTKITDLPSDLYKSSSSYHKQRTALITSKSCNSSALAMSKLILNSYHGQMVKYNQSPARITLPVVLSSIRQLPELRVKLDLTLLPCQKTKLNWTAAFACFVNHSKLDIMLSCSQLLKFLFLGKVWFLVEAVELLAVEAAQLPVVVLEEAEHPDDQMYLKRPASSAHHLDLILPKVDSVTFQAKPWSQPALRLLSLNTFKYNFPWPSRQCPDQNQLTIFWAFIHY